MRGREGLQEKDFTRELMQNTEEAACLSLTQKLLSASRFIPSLRISSTPFRPVFSVLYAPVVGIQWRAPLADGVVWGAGVPPE